MHITFSYRHSPQQIKVSLRSITYYALIIIGASFYTLGKKEGLFTDKDHHSLLWQEKITFKNSQKRNRFCLQSQ